LRSSNDGRHHPSQQSDVSDVESANRRGRVEGLPRVFCVISRRFSFLRLDSSALGELAGLLRLQHCPPAYIRRTSRPHS